MTEREKYLQEILKEFQYSGSLRWPVWRDPVQETFELESVPYYSWVKIQALEVAQLREQIALLQERLEQKIEQELIPINFIETQKIKLKKPFTVVLESYPQENLYIIECPEINVYGEGRDRTTALEDFKASLEETYFSLKADKDKLGPYPAKEWLFLNEIVEEKS